MAIFGKGKKPASNELTLTVAGVKRLSETVLYLDKYVDPDMILRKNGMTYNTTRYRAYRDLLFDAHTAGCIESRFAGTRLLEYSIETSGTTSADKRARDFIEDVFKSLDVSQIKSQILDAKLLGYSVNELVWQPDGGLWRPERIDEKPQEWFGFGSENQQLLYFDSYGSKGEPVDTDYKFLLCQNEPSFDNPFGKKLLSRIFWSVQFLKGGWEYWMEFAERFGQAFIIGKYPETWNARDPETRRKLDDLLDALIRLSGSATAAVPDSTNIQVTDGSNKSGTSGLYDTLIQRAESNISKVVLGSTLTVQQGTVGSEALGTVHQEVRQEIIESDKAFIKAYMDRLIRMITEVNFDMSVMPEFRHYEEDDLNKDRADRDAVLVAQGIKFTKDYYMKQYRFEDGDFEIPEPAASPAQDTGLLFGEKPQTFKKTASAYLALDGAVQSALGKLLDAAAESGKASFADTQNAISKIVKNASNWNEAANSVLEFSASGNVSANLTDAFEAAGTLGALYSKGQELLRIPGRKRVLKFAEDPDTTGGNIEAWLSKWLESTGAAGTESAAAVAASAKKELETIWTSRLSLDPDTYEKLTERARTRAFTISGNYTQDQVAQVYQSLYDAWRSGADLGDWKRDYLAKLELNPVIPDFQADTIWKQNLLNTYHAEQYRELKALSEDLPYWRYVAIMDENTSPICADLNGTIARADDPFWDKYYPPNHFGCRSDVQALTEEEAADYKESDPDYKTPSDVTRQPAQGFERNVAADAGEGFFGYLKETEGFSDDESKMTSGLVDPQKIDIKPYVYGDAVDNTGMYPVEQTAQYVKRAVSGEVVSKYQTGTQKFGETLVLRGADGREFQLSPKYLLDHFIDEAGNVKTDHFESLPYLSEALARPRLVTFAPVVSSATGKVFMQWHYFTNALIEIEPGNIQKHTVRVVVRYWRNQYLVVTSYLEDRQKVEGLIVYGAMR